MSLTIQYSEAKYYAEYDSTLLQSRISERFGTSVTAISREMLYPLYRLFNQTPCSYWDEKVAKQVLSQLENCYSQMPSIRIDDSAFEYFLMGYNAYNQLSDTISDLHDFNLEQTIKARMYQLPTYTSIVEGCISNLLRVIASIVSQVTGKDYITQSKLKNLIEMSDKNGFSEIASKINTNIRNAINHGKVTIHKEVAQNKIIFHYVENRKTCVLEMAPYEFEDEINTVYDAASGLLLGICLFLSSHNELIDVCRTNKNYLSFALLALELSMPPIHCYSINDTGNQKQLNVEYEVENTDRGYLQYLSMIAAIVVYSKYPDYEQYMINFVSSRMPGSWVRYKREDLIDVCSSHNNISTVWKRVVERKDCLIFPASTENIDMKEVKYFCFPSLSTEKYAIRNIQDASIQDRKRLRAHLFVGDVQNRNELISIIDEALEWLCQVKNPPSPNFEHKHGTMPADAIYLNVYKEDRRKDKNMFPSNTNFVCFVDYNSTGRTTLLHGGVPEKMWMQYHHEVLGQKEIAWRDTTYFTRHVEKVGRNDPCPCGSGKKYKNCCLK